MITMVFAKLTNLMALLILIVLTSWIVLMLALEMISIFLMIPHPRLSHCVANHQDEKDDNLPAIMLDVWGNVDISSGYINVPHMLLLVTTSGGVLFSSQCPF